MSLLQLISSMAAREPLAELCSRYEQQRRLPIRASAAGGVEVAAQVRLGLDADIVVLARNAIDRLAADGHVVAGSLVDLAHSDIAAAVRAGDRKPPFTTAADVKAAVLGARSLGFSTGPSGSYLEQLFARWRVLEAIRPRLVVPPPGVPVASLVADGRCELGFQQLSELLNQPGIALLGPLPADIQHLTTFSGGVTARSSQRAAAAALLAFMASAEADAVWRRYGLQPARDSTA